MASNTATANSSLDAFKPASMSLATLGLSLGTFMQVLDLTIANVSLPTIAGNLGASQDQSTWVITSFTICQAIMLPMTGFLTRRFGEVRVFVWSALLFSMFSLGCGFSTSLGMLVICRALQGAACGPMYPITQSLMVGIYPRNKRALALSIISMITVVAPIVGPILGGWITDSYSWRWIFFINVPIGIFASAVVFIQLSGRPEKLIRQRIDWMGIFTLIVGVGALQVLLDKGNDLDWFNSNTIIVLAILAIIALFVFVVWELTEDEPIVDLRLFRHRNFAVGTIVFVLCFALYFAIALMLPLWVQGTLGYTALWSGLAAAPVGIIPVLTVLWLGKNAHKFDMRLLSSIAFLAMGLTCFRLAGFNTQVDFMSIAITEFLMGIGVALFFLPVLTILLSDLDGIEVAEGSGSATFLRTVGASFAVSIVTYMWSRGTRASHAHLSEFINPYSDNVRHGIKTMGGNVQQYAAGINHVVRQQATQISFNHLLDILAIGFLLLVVVVWFAKPPFFQGGKR